MTLSEGGRVYSNRQSTVIWEGGALVKPSYNFNGV